MERLTINVYGCNQIKDCENDMCYETCDKFKDCTECPIKKAIDKLAQYEDATECGEITGLDFRNELVKRLNNNATRYVGSFVDGKYYPEVELFEVDEIYEIIDRILDGEPEDEGE